MTPEERIAQLEAALALERAKVHELSAALAAAVASAARVQQLDAERKARRAEQNRRAYEKRQQPTQHAFQQPIQRAESSAESPSPSLPPPFPSPSLSAPISPPPISSPIPSSPPSASQAPAGAAPFTLEVQAPKPRKREKSDAEKLYADLEDSRRQRCEEVGEVFVGEGWAAQRQNAQLGLLLKAPEEERSRLASAWSLYLADDGQRARTPAWSIGFFLTVRAKYETLAAREGTA